MFVQELKFADFEAIPKYGKHLARCQQYCKPEEDLIRYIQSAQDHGWLQPKNWKCDGVTCKIKSVALINN